MSNLLTNDTVKLTQMKEEDKQNNDLYPYGFSKKKYQNIV